MPLPANRREFLKTAAAAGPAMLLTSHATEAALVPTAAEAAPLRPNSIAVQDLPKHYDVEAGVHNLENGYWGIMPREVAAEYSRQIAYVNRNNSLWARNVLAGSCRAAGARAAQEAIARQVGCQVEEIAVARSGSEALRMLIVNYKGIKPGDAVVCCDLDYPEMICAMDWLGDHRGARVVKFAMPEPATTANVLAAYDDALRGAPSARLLLVTHVSNRTGLVTPVREIVAMARQRGVDTVVDAAHGIACLDFMLDDLGADFVGWSVHKWTSAPLGTGAMYIRRSRIMDIDIAYNDDADPAEDIAARIPTGTVDFAAVSSIPKAVEFHFAVGAAAKERHLRALRGRWVNAVRDLHNVEICVPDDPARYCAITSFRLKGMATDVDAQRVQRRLLEKYRVHTVWRPGIAKGPAIRVTPGFYSTNIDVDALVAALRAEHAMCL
jgi:selenocysteine lyase/cysteine desulfurase